MADLSNAPRSYRAESAAWALLLQTDWRFVLVFFRTDIRGYVLPPWFPVRVVVLIGLAALMRESIAAYVTIRTETAPNLVDFLVSDCTTWIALLVATFVASIRPACENRRRARDGTETEHEVSWAYVGWPKLVDPAIYAQASLIERETMWWRATVVYEPLLGFGAALLIGLVNAWIGWYIAFNVFWLWRISRQLAWSNTAERRQLQESIVNRAHTEILISEIDSRHSRAHDTDGKARLL